MSSPQNTDNYLDGPCELQHVQASLRKGLLLDQLCQVRSFAKLLSRVNIAHKISFNIYLLLLLQRFGQKLLKNTTQTIELLKLIIGQRADQPEVEEDELLLISFGILSTYLRDEIKLTEVRGIKHCIFYSRLIPVLLVPLLYLILTSL